MVEELNSPPNISYVYHTYNSSLGGPMWIIMYMQFVMLMLNAMLKLNMVYYELYLPAMCFIGLIVVGIVQK